MTKMCIAAANYIIRRTNDYNKDREYCKQISMTCKRLQKLLYFSEIEYMKRNNGKPMFEDDFHAWPSGPVIPSVYRKFMQFQYGNMIPLESNNSNLTKEMTDAMDIVLELTYNFDTVDLVDFSHVDGGPWARSYNADDPEHEQIISKEDIRDFYKKRNIFGVLQVELY